jgi:hypothetical protein
MKERSLIEKKMKLNFALPPMTSKAFSPNACNGPALS